MTFENNTTELCNNPELIDDLNVSLVTEKLTGWTRGVVIGAFVILSSVGAFGNCCLIVTMFAKRDKRSTIRCAFAINLAVSDLILCVFTQPLNLQQQIDREWRYGSVLCKLLPTIQSVNVFASSFSIAAIAIDRLHAVLQPYVKRPRQRNWTTTVCICCIWLIAILLSLPLVFFYSLTQFPPDNLVEDYFHECPDKVNRHDQCIYDSSTGNYHVMYTLASLFIWFFLNCMAVLIAHLCIWFRIVKSRDRMANASRTVITHNSESIEMKSASEPSSKSRQSTQAVVIYRRRKAKCLLIAIVMTFVISWLPINLLNLASDIEKSSKSAGNQTNESIGELMGDAEDESDVLNTVLNPLCNGLIFLSACLNPVFYGWLNDSCRRKFLSCYVHRREQVIENRQSDADGNSGDHRHVHDTRSNGRHKSYRPLPTAIDTIHTQTQNALTADALPVDTV